jgi:ribosomal-protein-alanine N-acetyltransferase
MTAAAAPAGSRPDWREALPHLAIGGAVLREPRASDAPSLVAHLATPEVGRFMSRPPDRPEAFQRFISWIAGERRAGRCLCFAIVPEDTSQAAGLIQVRQLEPGFGTAEWGFALGQAYWGRGIFIRAAAAVVDFVFRHVGAHRLEARASVENGRSNGALAKLGALQEGILRRSLMGGERPMDQWLWSIHADDWLAQRDDDGYALSWPVDAEQDSATPAAHAPPAQVPAWRLELPTMAGSLGTLRDLRRDDAARLLEHLSPPEVVRYIPPSPGSVEGFEQFIAWAHRQREAGKYACFGVVPAGERHAVGIFQLRQLEPSFRTAEWGFALGRAYWGSGLFLASAIRVLDFAFDTVGVRRLEARSAIGNERGNGALRKLGATLEGHLRRSFLLGGVYHDDAMWALLAEDWPGLRGSLARQP